MNHSQSRRYQPTMDQGQPIVTGYGAHVAPRPITPPYPLHHHPVSEDRTSKIARRNQLINQTNQLNIELESEDLVAGRTATPYNGRPFESHTAPHQPYDASPYIGNPMNSMNSNQAVDPFYQSLESPSAQVLGEATVEGDILLEPKHIGPQTTAARSSEDRNSSSATLASECGSSSRDRNNEEHCRLFKAHEELLRTMKET
ncbi:hypothetical protein DL95DRAFT_398755, partial [Leptodontidium sp. 2 PMI_412]